MGMSRTASRTVDTSTSLSPRLPEYLIERVMARLLERARPVTFRVAASDQEKEVSFRLRHAAIMARGWARPEDFPEGIERDTYDEDAIHMIGWHGDAPVATGRIVLPKPNRLLPTEEDFGLIAEPQGRFADAGRSVVVQGYSEMRHAVLLGMWAKCWYSFHELGLEDSCIGVTSPAMLRLYRRMGFPVHILGPSRSYWAEERFPILFDTPGVCRVLAELWGFEAI